MREKRVAQDMTNKTSKIALNILKNNVLCTHCLGRQLALIGSGTTNYERGSAVIISTIMNHLLEDEEKAIKSSKIFSKTKHSYAIETYKKLTGEELTPTEKCRLCEGIFDKIELIAKRALDAVSDIEFETFLFGSSFPPEWLVREEELWTEYGITTSESIKGHFNREVGKKFSEITGKEFDRKKPDVTLIVHIPDIRIERYVSSIFLKARYRKLVRNIPQTRWPCNECDGIGCEACNYTGKRYPTSVEEEISPLVVETFEGKDSKFHGAGREDVDALMLGSGRPFVIEIISPKKRHADLEELTRKINEKAKGKVEITRLEYTDKDLVRALKENASQAVKTYRAKIYCEKPIDKERLKILEKKFTDQQLIKQRTPNRVSHRRADLIRHKVVYSVKIDDILNQQEFVAIIECQGGLYVKELISGDEGRTKPSFSELLDNNCKCVELDVLDVKEKI